MTIWCQQHTWNIKETATWTSLNDPCICCVCAAGITASFDGLRKILESRYSSWDVQNTIKIDAFLERWSGIDTGTHCSFILMRQETACVDLHEDNKCRCFKACNMLPMCAVFKGLQRVDIRSSCLSCVCPAFSCFGDFRLKRSKHHSSFIQPSFDCFYFGMLPVPHCTVL